MDNWVPWTLKTIAKRCDHSQPYFGNYNMLVGEFTKLSNSVKKTSKVTYGKYLGL